jgi:hypothetical protein
MVSDIPLSTYQGAPPLRGGRAIRSNSFGIPLLSLARSQGKAAPGEKKEKTRGCFNGPPPNSAAKTMPCALFLPQQDSADLL